VTTGGRLPAAALAILMAGIAVVGIGSLMLSPMLTDVMADLRAGPERIGLAVGGYGAGVALSAFISAPRLDRWPRRTALQAAFFLMMAGFAIAGFAFDWRVLLAGQFVSGVACGVAIPGTYAAAADISPPEMRTQALGRVVLGWSIALVMGVPLAAVMADTVGWRGAFALVAALSGAQALLLTRLRITARTSTDAPAAYGATLAAPGVKPLLLGTLAFMFAFYGSYAFLGDHLRQLHGVGAWLVGLVAMSYGAGYGITALADRLIDRVDPRRVLPPAMAFVCLEYLVLPFMTRAAAVMIAFAFVWGVINHFAMTSLVSSISRAPAGARGTALGLFSTVTYVAHGLSGPVMGWLYAHHGFEAVSWTAAAGAGALAVVLALTVLPLSRRS
jgi:predicted MFS family arabinose efflux permease